MSAVLWFATSVQLWITRASARRATSVVNRVSHSVTTATTARRQSRTAAAQTVSGRLSHRWSAVRDLALAPQEMTLTTSRIVGSISMRTGTDAQRHAWTGTRVWLEDRLFIHAGRRDSGSVVTCAAFRWYVARSLPRRIPGHARRGHTATKWTARRPHSASRSVATATHSTELPTRRITRATWWIKKAAGSVAQSTASPGAVRRRHHVRTQKRARPAISARLSARPATNRQRPTPLATPLATNTIAMRVVSGHHHPILTAAVSAARKPSAHQRGGRFLWWSSAGRLLFTCVVSAW